MFQLLYILACIFLVLWLLFWVVGVLVHTLFFLIALSFKLLLPVAIVIFVIGFFMRKSRR